MTPTELLRARLDELCVEHDTYDLPNGEHGVSWIDDNDIEWEAVQRGENFEIHALQLVTPEQAIAATVGVEKWEPSKEWKVWHDSLKHDNPTSIREAVENILYEAIDFGGDMGPNGNVWSGVDEGAVLTENCIDGWVESVESIAATVGAGTCHGEIDSDYFECKLTTFKCHSCGWSGIVDNGYAGYSFGGTDIPRHCPNCGAKVVSE